MTRPLVPIDNVEPKRWLYLLARAVNTLLKGGADVVGAFTLTAGATSTTVSDNLFESQMVPVLVPTSANAAGALATTYVSARAKGSFTLTHANAATVDRTFLYIRWG